MQYHINEGKSELNFSEFASYSDRRKKSKFKSIISQVKKEEMPLRSYTFIHDNAILSVQDKIILTEWVEILRDSI